MAQSLAIYLGDTSGNVQANPVHQRWLEASTTSKLVLPTPRRLGPFKHTVLRNFGLIREIPAEIESETIIFESPATLYCAPLIRSRAPNATLIFIDATWHTAGPSVYDYDSLSLPKEYLYRLDRRIDSRLLRQIYQQTLDGVITVSDMMVEHIKSFVNIPMKVVRPTISDTEVDRMSNVDPDLSSKRAVFVGMPRGHKGVSMLVEAWPAVREKVPEASLELVGDHDLSYERIDGVTVRGYEDDLVSVFQEASIQVHPALFDASPVSTLMGMQAGLPQLVTDKTGTKSEVMRIDPSLVVPANSDSIASGVVGYFQNPLNIKQNYSRLARDIASNFSESYRSGEFQERLNELLGEIEVKK